jgi:hypothetical protein
MPDQTLPDVGQGKGWGLALVRIDRAWTKVELWLCTVVLLLEVAALTIWVAFQGLSTGPDGSAAGITLRALTGAAVLGTAAYWALRKRPLGARRAACIGGVLLGLVAAKAWANVGVEWSANVLNWLQQASTLTLFGGLRGIGTRLTLALALLGGSLATAAGRHITIDLLTRYLKPRVRVPVTIAGWTAAFVVCSVAAWGFFDHVSIEDFGARADASVGEKVEAVGRGVGEHAFVARKQIALDLKCLPHVLAGESYADWLTGEEWNRWLESAGFVERYGAKKIEALRIPADAKRAPIVVVPGVGEPRGALTHAANLVFPFGLLIIALRFVLLSLLTLSGQMKLDGEALQHGVRESEPAPAGEKA